MDREVTRCMWRKRVKIGKEWRRWTWVMKCINNKWSWVIRCIVCEKSVLVNEVVPEIHFVALLQLKAPARAISVESTLALNPWCFGAKVVYVHTSGTHPPHCKAIHDSLSVLLKLEKVKQLRLTHSTRQIITPPSELEPQSHKCLVFPKALPRALSNTRHMHKWSKSSEGGGSKSLWNKVL